MEKRLVVKLDSCTGNIDEMVCCLLTGSGEGNAGSVEATKLYERYLEPLLDEFIDLVEFTSFLTEHGRSCYDMDETNICNTVLGLDEDTEIDDLVEMIALWKEAYAATDGIIEINVPLTNYADNDEELFQNIRILGFELIEIDELRIQL